MVTAYLTKDTIFDGDMKVLMQLVYITFFAVLPLSFFGQRAFHMSMEDGLCTNNLTDQYFDSKSNLWIASYNGLMKHEGGRITTYNKKNRDDKYNLSSLEIHSVIEDKCGLIWIATTNGVNILNPTSNIIEKIYLKSSIDGSTFIGYIYWIWQDNEEFIWVSTDIGIYKIDNNTLQPQKIISSKDKYGIPNQIVSYNGGISDKQGLWMMTNGGLVYYEYATKEFHHHFHNPKKFKALNWTETLIGNQSDLKMDTNGNLWFIHHAKWLVKFNPASNELDTFKLNLPKETWKCCMSLEVDHKGNVWIGTRHGGILIFDKDEKSFKAFDFHGINSLIQSNYIYSLTSDKKGLMFIATSNGLDIIDYYNHSLKEITLSGEPHFMNIKYESGDISFDQVKNLVYVPFYHFGYFEYDEQNSYVISKPLSNGTPLVINQSDGLNISQIDGLNHYKINARDYTSSLIPRITKKDSSYIIWYLPINNDEYIIKRNKGKIHHYKADSIYTLVGKGFKPNICLSKDSCSIWFINADMNLSRYQIKNRSEVKFHIQQKLLKSNKSFSNPRHIFDDGESIWSTSQNGVLRYFYNLDSLALYDMNNGLLHDFTFGVVADLKNNIWVASMGGINKFDRTTNTFQTILPLTETSYMDAFGHAICNEKGVLYFHFGNKLYRIDPNIFPPNDKAKNLALSFIRINDAFISYNDVALKELNYNQNNIQVAFALKDFLYPTLASYNYQLNGGSWISIGKETSLMFNSLKPGKYSLKISAIDYYDNPADHVVELNFKINPPFYQSYWFMCLIILSIITIAYFWYKSKLAVIVNKNKISLQIAELKATAIKAQMNPHFIFNSLNSIQECVMNGETDKAYDYITLFSKFLRSVLNYSNQNNITIHEEIDLVRLYLKLESFRFKQDISLHEDYGVGIEPEIDNVPALILQPIIENAIWHGLRNKEGEKNIWLHFIDGTNHFTIRVIDDGLGYKADNKSKRPYESMGLKLVKERIEAQWLDKKSMDTIFKIESVHKDGFCIGTQVTIELPKISNLNKIKNENLYHR